MGLYRFPYVVGRVRIKIYCDDETDLLYIRFDERKQQVMNKRVREDVVLDIGDEHKIVGIEVLDASKHINLEALLAVRYEVQE